MMRIVLFALTNVAVLVVFSIVARIFGLDKMLASSQGIPFTGLLIMAAVLGMGGSFVSLLISKWMAKRSTGAEVIETPANETEAWLKATVARLSERAGIGMPDVAIFRSDTVNAFATGARRDSALVAVSTGLLATMDRREVEAVLGHEIAHVANGDMVTLTLIQGVLNTFVIFLSRVVGSVVDSMLSRGGERRGYGIGYFVTSMVAQVVLGFLATIVVSWFSRYREFRADEGGAEFSSRDNMISALEALKRGNRPAVLPESMAAMGISNSLKGRFGKLFATHPPLDVRIAALRGGR